MPRSPPAPPREGVDLPSSTEHPRRRPPLRPSSSTKRATFQPRLRGGPSRPPRAEGRERRSRGGGTPEDMYDGQWAWSTRRARAKEEDRKTHGRSTTAVRGQSGWPTPALLDGEGMAMDGEEAATVRCPLGKPKAFPRGVGAVPPRTWRSDHDRRAAREPIRHQPPASSPGRNGEEKKRGGEQTIQGSQDVTQVNRSDESGVPARHTSCRVTESPARARTTTPRRRGPRRSAAPPMEDPASGAH